MQHHNETIGFIGAGNMAGSLIAGLLATGFPAQRIWASDPQTEQLSKLADSQGVNVTSNNDQLTANADIVVLAVKPQVLEQVIKPLHQSLLNKQALVISIAAGIPISALQQWIPDVPLIRCMPNTPALVSQGAAGLFATSQVSDAQKASALAILQAVGIAVWVDSEDLIDVVTAVSGSGPAYYFLFMEAMEQAAIEMGLDADTARLLVQQTALGAATMVKQTTEPPAELRRKVTSPGGTTERALAIFEQQQLRSITSQALNGARERAIELSNNTGQNA